MPPFSLACCVISMCCLLCCCTTRSNDTCYWLSRDHVHLAGHHRRTVVLPSSFLGPHGGGVLVDIIMLGWSKNIYVYICIYMYVYIHIHIFMHVCRYVCLLHPNMMMSTRTPPPCGPKKEDERQTRGSSTKEQHGRYAAGRATAHACTQQGQAPRSSSQIF